MQQKRKLCRRETFGTLEMHFPTLLVQRAVWLLTQVYQNLTEWLKVKEYPRTWRLKRCFVQDYHKAKTEVLFNLESCCNFLLDYSRASGWGRIQHSTWDGIKQDILQDTKTQGKEGNWAVSWAVSKGTEKLWFPLWNVLSLVLSFPIYAVRKKTLLKTQAAD